MYSLLPQDKETHNQLSGLIRTRRRNEMLFARQTIVNAAGAYGLQSLDLVRSVIKR